MIDKLQISIKVAEKIIGKKVVIGKGAFKQNENEIFGDTWQEILHEVAHWLVATKEERLEPNIGFPDDPNNETIHNLKQEVRACILHFKLNRLFPMNENENDYNEYIIDSYNRIPKAQISYTEMVDIFNSFDMNQEVQSAIKEIKQYIK